MMKIQKTIPGRLTVALLIAIVSAPLSADTIKIATGEYAPYSGKALYNQGFALHVISEAFKLVGHNAEFVYMPWNRAYDKTNQGEFHATGAWGYKPEREVDFHFSNPIYQSRTVLFHVRDNPVSNWNELTDLIQYKVGATRGYTYTEAFWDLENIDVAGSDELNFRKLLRNRIDLFPMNEVSGADLIRSKFENYQYRLTMLDKPLIEFPSMLLFPKELKPSIELRNTFNEGLRQLISSRLYDQMLKNMLDGKYSP